MTHDCSRTPRYGRHYSRTLIWRHSVRKTVGPCRKTRHTILPTIPQKLARPCNRRGVGTSGRKAEGCLVGCGEAVSRRLAGESLFPIPHSDGCGSGGCSKGERERGLWRAWRITRRSGVKMVYRICWALLKSGSDVT